MRRGCTCVGHEHDGDSRLPDYCYKCACACNQAWGRSALII
jgi:hypothetical protein